MKRDLKSECELEGEEWEQKERERDSFLSPIPLTLPPPPPTTTSLVLSRHDHYVGSKENNGAESDTLILALGICEFH